MDAAETHEIDETVDTDASDERRISRRRAIRAAAATGVGVAAWALPSIRSVGSTPVYAAACSFGTLTEFAEDGGGNVNCGTACAALTSLGWLGAGNNRRNISGPGFTGDLTFLDPAPECSEIERTVTIAATRTSDGATLSCTLTGVNIEAINNTTPVPANSGRMPAIANGLPAPTIFCQPGTTSPFVDCTPATPVWQGIQKKNGGIGNICSSQWGIVMECHVVC